MEEFEKAVLEAIKRQPERNPDGTLWRWQAGEKSWTKEYILKNWDKDQEMREFIVKTMLEYGTHLAGRKKL